MQTENRNSKRPLALFYGGKYRLAEWIISLFPEDYHKLYYVEPFAGALNVFFAKEKSYLESVSDTNKNLYFFYKVLRDSPKELIRKLKNTIYCENTHKEAKDIYFNPDITDELKKAWAVFIIFNISVSGVAGGGFGYKISWRGPDGPPQRFLKQKELLNFLYKRMDSVQVFNRPADWFIERFKDENKCLMCLDPPYPGADQAHYKGFSMDDFNQMLEKLKTVKFKWLLSFYEKEGMKLSVFKKDDRFRLLKTKLVCRTVKDVQERTESLLLNYLPAGQESLF